MYLKSSLVISKRCLAQVNVATKPKPEEPVANKSLQKKSFRKFLKNHVRVTILGSDTTAGKALAFLLKQNPIISQIYLHGKGAKGTVLDLQHLDTRCRVKGFEDQVQLAEAVRCGEIIVLMGLGKFPQSVDPEKRVKHEAKRIAKLATICTKFAPRSIVLVAAHPVSYLLPLVTAVYKKTDWYHPGKLIGSADLTQIRVNSLAARYQDLDPVSVHVPIIGGPESNTVVPLFSRAQPCDIPTDDAEILNDRIKQIVKEKTVKSIEKCELRMSSFSEAYGINRTITTIALGLCGDGHAACACFLRQNIIDTCKHLVTTVKFGRSGVEHNYGIPKLTRNELQHFEMVLQRLRKREKKATKILDKLKPDRDIENESIALLSPYSNPKTKSD